MENFREIRRHLADNAVDMEKTPLVLGPWIGIDSEKERFINNPAANAMLTREYRKPFVMSGENGLKAERKGVRSNRRRQRPSLPPCGRRRMSGQAN